MDIKAIWKLFNKRSKSVVVILNGPVFEQTEIRRRRTKMLLSNHSAILQTKNCYIIQTGSQLTDFSFTNEHQKASIYSINFTHSQLVILKNTERKRENHFLTFYQIYFS